MSILFIRKLFERNVARRKKGRHVIVENMYSSIFPMLPLPFAYLTTRYLVTYENLSLPQQVFIPWLVLVVLQIIAMSAAVYMYYSIMSDYKKEIARKMLDWERDGDMESLTDALDDKEEEVRKAAINSLANISGPEAVGRISEALNDKKVFVRKTAVKTLASMGGEEVVGPLIRALEDENRIVRKAAIKALTSVGNNNTIKPLSKLLDDDDEIIRLAALQALAAIGEKSGKKG
jgi:oligoendopeptidase F